MKETWANEGYPFRQLAKAFLTAVLHDDAATRERAEERIDRWRKVVDGMASGRLRIGSRTPVAEMPAWVTPEVVHGGFVTGEPAAGGETQPHEYELAKRAGIPSNRGAAFTYFLTEQGLAELDTMLDAGTYDVTVPEEAALLVVAWLVRAGDPARALELVDELAPFSDQLRFTPRPADAPAADPEIVYRETAGEVGEAVARRRPNERVETMREALTVWNPFADQLLTHWLQTVVTGRVADETKADRRLAGTRPHVAAPIRRAGRRPHPLHQAPQPQGQPRDPAHRNRNNRRRTAARAPPTRPAAACRRRHGAPPREARIPAAQRDSPGAGQGGGQAQPPRDRPDRRTPAVRTPPANRRGLGRHHHAPGHRAGRSCGRNPRRR